jgi:hypothetical protein
MSETVFVTGVQVSDPVTFIDNERGVIDICVHAPVSPDSIKALYIAKPIDKKRETRSQVDLICLISDSM